MGNLLIDIIELSMPVTALIAVLLMMSPLLKRTYVSKWRYFMWLFVAVRLLLPFRFHYSSPITMEIPAEISAPINAARAAQVTTSGGLTPLQILTIVWLVGIAAFAIYRVGCYISFKRLVKRWQSDITDETVLREFRAAKDFAGVKRDIEIKRCKAVSTPMVFGIIKPVLLMPDIDFTADELNIVLRHELVHLKRNDVLYKLLIMVVCTLYWFNPMMYVMAKAANKDLELACDAEVVKREGAAFRCRYCETIMRLVHNRRGAQTALSTCFFFSKKTVMERFKYILDEKIKRNGVIMFCVVAISFALSGGVVSFATERVAVEFEDNLQILEREPEPPKPTAVPAAPATEPPAQNSGTSNDRSNYNNSYTYEAPVYEYYAEDNGGAAAEEETPATEPMEEVPEGAELDSIYDRLTEPSEVSSDGSRETYNLSDGNTAIVQYDGDTIDSGYILVN